MSRNRQHCLFKITARNIFASPSVINHVMSFTAFLSCLMYTDATKQVSITYSMIR
jgi:hypothetical protein